MFYAILNGILLYILISLICINYFAFADNSKSSASASGTNENLLESNNRDGNGVINSIITYLTTTKLLFEGSKFLFSKSEESEDDLTDTNYGSVVNLEFMNTNTPTWLWSAFASIIVALTGVIPAIFLTSSSNERRKEGSERTLNRLLSFAVGSLLGDVFLHILPETWQYVSAGHESAQNWGMWVIFGSVICFMVEKCASGAEDSKHKAAAFVNLCANAIDNFTHGLAVGASFSVSVKFGLLTTFAILIHEIPHEISDFAILLRADFDRWSAVKAQLVTACGGFFGAGFALIANNGVEGLERRAACWILPFTAGGFLNVALVQVLPDLLKENSIKESAMQVVYIVTGVVLMGLLSSMHFSG